MHVLISCAALVKQAHESVQNVSIVVFHTNSAQFPLTSFMTSHSKKSGKIKSGFQREHINLGCDVDYDINGTAVHGAVVVGFEGWLAGYQMTFEAGRNRVTQSNFAVGYKSDEFQLHTNVYVPNAVSSDPR